MKKVSALKLLRAEQHGKRQAIAEARAKLREQSYELSAASRAVSQQIKKDLYSEFKRNPSPFNNVLSGFSFGVSRGSTFQNQECKTLVCDHVRDSGELDALIRGLQQRKYRIASLMTENEFLRYIEV